MLSLFLEISVITVVTNWDRETVMWCLDIDGQQPFSWYYKHKGFKDKAKHEC